jgi:hypothetical protein
MKLVLIALSLLLSLPAHAAIPSGLKAQPLVTITNDKDNARIVLSALIDRNQSLAGIYSQGSGPGQVYWLKDIENQGVTLVERYGYSLISLQGRLSRDTQEGRLTARYLVHAFRGTREDCPFELRKNNSGWYVRNIYTRRAVQRIHVLAGDSGIRQLQGLCPAGK